MCPCRADKRPGPGDAATLFNVPASRRRVEYGRHQPETEDCQERDVELDGHRLEHQDPIALVEPRGLQQGGGARGALRELGKGEDAAARSGALDDGGRLGPLRGLIDQDLRDVHAVKSPECIENITLCNVVFTFMRLGHLPLRVRDSSCQRPLIEGIATDRSAIACRDAPRPVGLVHQDVNGALEPELPCGLLAVIHQETAQPVSTARRMDGHRLHDHRTQRLAPRRLREVRDAEDEADELPAALREQDQFGRQMGTDRSVGGEEGIEPDGAVEEVVRERLERQFVNGREFGLEALDVDGAQGDAVAFELGPTLLGARVATGEVWIQRREVGGQRRKPAS